MLSLILYAVFIQNICSQDLHSVKILLLIQDGQEQIVKWSEDIFSSLVGDMKIETIFVNLSNDEDDYDKVCTGFEDGGSMIIDLTWSGSESATKISNEMNVPYIKIDVSISPALLILNSYLDYRNSTDVALIFDNPNNVDQALYFWINTSRLRMLMTENLDKTSAERMRGIRPPPNNFAVVATTENVTTLFKTALDENLVTLPERWNLVFLDFDHRNFDRKLLQNLPINLLMLDVEMCCAFINREVDCECPKDFILQEKVLSVCLNIIHDVLKHMIKEHLELTNTLLCNATIYNEQSAKRFKEILNNYVEQNKLIDRNNDILQAKIKGTVEVGSENGSDVIAKYEGTNVKPVEGKKIPSIKAFYRVGITHALPWSYEENDPVTGETYWTGYCADFVQKLSELMNFDYEFVEPKKGDFGKKVNGIWDGIIGDLAAGETDLAISAIIMTADREEVVDFVAPYFEQTGVTIVMRKPVRKTSLFKFMTVLKLEVWLSIVGSLVVTGFTLWFLDKYSPYSARNSKQEYPYPCREFTLKESFWFALTSFTPQGGGEAPKALSGRTLVAAYWLFVVLMLATFTANLAAFLTVERMQTPVQSLEQLARQSRINYTVVQNSLTHEYFINMKNAEDTLYRMWKELTLNASTDDKQYRVWDYPIREQYGHILIAINDSNPVADAAEGFRTVNEHLDADFAFIHDSSEIKYEISRNCNLTEVGEVFAEKPYAVAVQQGSHLQDEISKMILNLQKDRFFEELEAKYWNHSAKGECPNTDDNEGITLESLGGVFIATLFGLALAMITLACEVLYYKRKKKTQERKQTPQAFPEKILRNIPGHLINQKDGPITIGTTFKPVTFKDNFQEKHISLYPRARNRITQVND